MVNASETSLDEPASGMKLGVTMSVCVCLIFDRFFCFFSHHMHREEAGHQRKENSEMTSDQNCLR